MQVYALDSKGKPISAHEAQKHLDYQCIECRSKVRLRGGLYRKNHFYHMEPDRVCRQNGKSMEHLQVQYYLWDHLPAGECILEQQFPDINRIADVYWPKEKIVFEVQCSPITAGEVQERKADYAKKGLSVIWILHEKNFNRWRLTAAEQFLDVQIHYYTNMDAEGQGMIYDQVQVCHKGRRIYTSEKRGISLQVEKEIEPKGLPLSLQQKIKSSGFFLSGDWIDCCRLNQGNACLEKVLEIEKELFGRPKRSWKEIGRLVLYHGVVRPYQLLLQIALEKAARG